MIMVFIRHSAVAVDPIVRITDWQLSEAGRHLAERLADTDVMASLGVIYASDQIKAKQTAVILAAPNNLTVNIDPSLTEVTSFTGPFESDPQIYESNIASFYNGSIQRISGGETKIEALSRFNKALDRIVDREQTRRSIGIVSHANILALFSEQYADIDPYVVHRAIGRPDVAVFDWGIRRFTTFFGNARVLPRSRELREEA